jgi:hypothetical protein
MALQSHNYTCPTIFSGVPVKTVLPYKKKDKVLINSYKKPSIKKPILSGV